MSGCIDYHDERDDGDRNGQDRSCSVAGLFGIVGQRAADGCVGVSSNHEFLFHVRVSGEC
jgi:hypothetical protein